MLLLLSEYIMTRTPERLANVSRAVGAMEATPLAGTPLHAVIAHVADRLRIAITLAAADGKAAAACRATRRRRCASGCSGRCGRT